MLVLIMGCLGNITVSEKNESFDANCNPILEELIDHNGYFFTRD